MCLLSESIKKNGSKTTKKRGKHHFPHNKTMGVILAHLSQRLIGELIGYPWSGVRRPSSVVVVRPQFQMFSPLKPLDQSKPNFMCSLLGKGERKFL